MGESGIQNVGSTRAPGAAASSTRRSILGAVVKSGAAAVVLLTAVLLPTIWLILALTMSIKSGVAGTAGDDSAPAAAPSVAGGTACATTNEMTFSQVTYKREGCGG